ncbi:MAG: NAD-dependent epimerase/dehydratase family protein [bacterium]|nr:NAD-dependent epimerase/dehydratase family protein [bacterium]
MKVLITGGAGFIGSFVAERFLAEGCDVTVLDNFDEQVHPPGEPTNVPPGAHLVYADVRDERALRYSALDAELIIHCASAVGVAQSLYRIHHYVDVNARGTAALLQILTQHKHSLRKLVLLTSMVAYGEGLYQRPSDGKLMRVPVRTEKDLKKSGWEVVCPVTGEALVPTPTPEDAALHGANIYALTKRYQEELAFSIGNLFDFPVVCLRLFNVYGPRQSLSNPYTGVLAIFLSRLLAHRKPVVYEDGKQSRDFISVHDVVRAVILACEQTAADGEVINIGSGIQRYVGSCARDLARLMGVDQVEPEITHLFRKGDIRHCIADISKARRLLGFAPRIAWEEGLGELIEWTRTTWSTDRLDTAQGELSQHGLLVDRRARPETGS